MTKQRTRRSNLARGTSVCAVEGEAAERKDAGEKAWAKERGRRKRRGRRGRRARRGGSGGEGEGNAVVMSSCLDARLSDPGSIAISCRREREGEKKQKRERKRERERGTPKQTPESRSDQCNRSLSGRKELGLVGGRWLAIQKEEARKSNEHRKGDKEVGTRREMIRKYATGAGSEEGEQGSRKEGRELERTRDGSEEAEEVR